METDPDRVLERLRREINEEPVDWQARAEAAEAKLAAIRELCEEAGTRTGGRVLAIMAAAARKGRAAGDLELLGKRVRAELGENAVQEGVLLGFGDGGDIEIEGDDGLVWHGWPRLEMMPAPQPTRESVSVRTRTTRYEVFAFPDEIRDDPHSDGRHFAITVEWRGPGKWAVLRDGEALGSDGEWDYESIPSERKDKWLATHRFDLQTALDLAREQAPKITVNGWTVAQVLEKYRTKKAAGHA